MISRLYVEGGGDAKVLRTACREGFRKLLERAGMKGRMPRIVACGGRRETYDSFVTAHAKQQDGGLVMLLIDSEGPVAGAATWAHLAARDQWERPVGATEAQCHLMVQIMESWFLADSAALGRFFGNGYRESALPGNARVEEVAKDEVIESLGRAARDCQRGGYRKGRDSFAILGAIDPAKIEAAAPFAKHFFDKLRSISQE